MKDILLELLERLEEIEQQHPELGDSDTRQMIGDAVMEGFVRANPNYMLPVGFGMRSSEGNDLVRTALDEYIQSATIAAKSSGLSEFHERLSAVQDRSVITENKRDYEDYLGHTEPSLYGRTGEAVSDN